MLINNIKKNINIFLVSSIIIIKDSRLCTDCVDNMALKSMTRRALTLSSVRFMAVAVACTHSLSIYKQYNEYSKTSYYNNVNSATAGERLITDESSRPDH